MSFKLEQSIDTMKKTDLQKALRKAMQYIKTSPAVKAVQSNEYDKIGASQFIKDGVHYTEVIEYTTDEKGNVFGKVKETEEHRELNIRRLYFDDVIVLEKLIDQEVK